SLYNLCAIFLAEHKENLASPYYLPLYQITTTTRDPIPPEWAARFVAFYGPSLVKAGLPAQAEEPLREAYRRLKDTGQPFSPLMREVLVGLVQTTEARGSEDAPAWKKELEAWDQAMSGSATTRPAKLLPLAPLVPEQVENEN